MQRIQGRIACGLILGLLVCQPALSADGSEAHSDPAKAGIDYQVQGEYEGVVDADGQKWGAQVIALGDGTFRLVGYQGGLPGNGWRRGDESKSVDGKLEGDVAVFDGAEFVLHADGKVLKIESVDGDALGELKKVHRESPTLGKQPPDGAMVLFDGTNTDAWNNGKLTEEGYLAATGLDTKHQFQDHSLHIEFQTPFMPSARGQARGNSGVYVQSRYEVQVLDSFGLDGADNECGGIYSVSKPALNMCYPPLTWQTYDIDFQAARFDDQGNKTQNARITVRHNGVLIHDNRELPHSTPGRLGSEGPEAAPLYLQDHGNPVLFRNIWAMEK
jgi:hypothetical protein